MAMLLLVSCAPAVTPPGLKLRYPAAADSSMLPNYRALARHIAPAYVWIEIHDPSAVDKHRDRSAERSLVNAGSGTVIDTCGHVITAAHIAVAVHMEARVIDHNGRTHKARIIDIAPQRELSLLRLNDHRTLRPPPLTDTARSAAGTVVLSIGAAGNQPGRVVLGRVLDSRPMIAYADYQFGDALALEMAVSPGHSGGPVVNSAGELLGMVAGFAYGADGYAVDPPLAYAIRSEAIASYLDSVTSVNPDEDPALAASVPARPSDVHPQCGRPDGLEGRPRRLSVVP